MAPGDSVVFLVGNFAAQHNGAVITCDSAVRYSDMRIEFFGNVLINKNTTYIYGDRAEYDGERNEARVYSDIVKVIDGDATLYTYDFIFNTKSNVGRFDQGGVLTNRENLLEAVRGYYYADTKELVAVDQVEMRNDEYDLQGRFGRLQHGHGQCLFLQTYEHLEPRRRLPLRRPGLLREARYALYRNAQRLPAHRSRRSGATASTSTAGADHVILRRDLQMDDTEHKAVGFGITASTGRIRAMPF